MKRIVLLCLILSIASPFCSCQPKAEYTWHSEVLTGYFDTIITLVAYTKTQVEFDAFLAEAEAEFGRLHRLYDIYSNYPGLANAKTINDQAGLQPVVVDADLLNLVKMAREWSLSGTRKTNIALGPVLEIWHSYRREGLNDPEKAQLPPREQLEAATQYTDASEILIDEKLSTVFLTDRRMSLDLGAVAKGYATEIVARKLQASGLTSGAINAGGNVRTIGKPLDGVRDRWGIGIMDPDSSLFTDDRNLDVVYVTDSAVVTSGDYQRYYYVQGVRYHHLIDPDTLFPAEYYRALTVVTKDSGLADLLSTELFLLPYEEGRALAESFENVQVMWIMPGGEVRVTPGLEKLLRSNGASGKD